MRRHLPLAAALLLCLPLLATAQGDKSDDEVAIRRVVQLYIDGLNSNDAESLSKSLHPKGKWFVPSHTRDLTEIKQGRVVDNIRDNRRKGIGVDKGDSRIVSVDVTNDVAVVKVEFERPHSYITRNEGDRSIQPLGVKQTDYLSLLRLAAGWKIVGKVTALEELQGARQQASR